MHRPMRGRRLKGRSPIGWRALPYSSKPIIRPWRQALAGWWICSARLGSDLTGPHDGIEHLGGDAPDGLGTGCRSVGRRTIGCRVSREHGDTAMAGDGNDYAAVALFVELLGLR